MTQRATLAPGFLVGLLTGLCAAAGSVPAVATEAAYPPGVIRIFVPYGAGNPPDVVGRLISTELSEIIGRRTIVENRPGGLATIAMRDVLRQPADGRTVILFDSPMAASSALASNLGLRVETDFSPVIKISRAYNVLVVHPSVPARTVAELVSVLKSQPDRFTFSTGPFGTPAHLIAEMFKLQVGVRATQVPYPGVQARLMDLVGGITQGDFLATSLALDFIATGKLRPLAVTSPQRVAALADVPTVVEEGFPDLVVEGWFGFAVKNGTPNELIARLNEAINTILANPKIRQALANLGAEPAGGTPAEFGLFIKSEVARWARVVKESGIKLQE